MSGLYDAFDSRSHILYLQSADKISGTNNNGTYNIDWSQFLPQNYNEYKIIFTIQTVGGFYKDISGTNIYSTAKVQANFGSRSFSYDTSTRGSSSTIGYISRDQQTATTSSNVLSNFYLQYPPKTIGRPTGNMLTISITNMFSNTPLVDTDAAGVVKTDMSAFQACFEFIPISSSLIQNRIGQNL